MFLEVHGEDTKAFCTGGKDVIDCMTDDKNRIFVMELILHCSDTSRPSDFSLSPCRQNSYATYDK